jgi:hypothetical protein
MANQGNREIWENGVPLNDAWFEFADPDAKRRYSELSAPEALSEQAANMRTGSDISKFIISGMQRWSEHGQFQRELQELLLDELFNDQLHAYGYRIAPSRSRVPVRIAAELFECPDVDWKQDRMIARGCTYSEIQIIDPTAIAGWKKRRHGPKGSGDVIHAAIDAIRTRRTDFCDIPRQAAFDLIRQEIGGAQQKGSGLSDPNLAKYVNKVCGTRRIKRN